MAETASAQFLPVQEEPAPGITMSGTGLARVAAPGRPSDDSIQRAIEAAQPSAASRAVRDAHRRSAAIARAAGVQLGRAVKVELRDEFSSSGSHGATVECRGGTNRRVAACPLSRRPSRP
jgi:hypothetical protein